MRTATFPNTKQHGDGRVELIDSTRIEASPLSKLIVTDSIPLPAEKRRCEKIVVLSIAELMGKAIRNIHEEASVTSLFV